MATTVICSVFHKFLGFFTKFDPKESLPLPSPMHLPASSPFDQDSDWDVSDFIDRLKRYMKVS